MVLSLSSQTMNAMAAGTVKMPNDHLTRASSSASSMMASQSTTTM